MGSGIWYLGYGIWGKWSLEESCRLNFTILALVVTPLKQHNLAKQQSTPLLTAYSYVSWPKTNCSPLSRQVLNMQAILNPASPFLSASVSYFLNFLCALSPAFHLLSPIRVPLYGKRCREMCQDKKQLCIFTNPVRCRWKSIKNGVRSTRKCAGDVWFQFSLGHYLALFNLG